MAYLASSEGNTYQSIKRIRIWYALLILVMAIFLVRVFYLQVIRYDHYKNAALSDQLKQYQVPATRGSILGYDGDKTLPIVLNEKLYTLYADPAFIKDAPKVARDVTNIVGGDTDKYEKLMRTKDSRYQILAKKVTEEQKDKITKLEHPGLGTTRQDYRTYPQGTLASQVLGFVNDEGVGSYGIEQALNDKLKGQAGELKAIT
ncbi:MAG: putative Peptidoglycan glycosyltransferase, partial [Candidatus Saccharibacteria bacterium]|nr:putative Peptidoglycan glycosyltransferase [Candidatus Saccharibacteria bacterium]